MGLEHLLILGWVVVVVLAAGVGASLWYRRRVWRQQRHDSWRELCLRLELAPQPGSARVAKGELPDTDFLLHDTGSDWLVELPLAQPLLPPGLLLLSPNAPTLAPRLELRPLAWGATSMPSELLTCYVDGTEPPGTVEAPQAFLDEATRAAQAHAPLRVEPKRLIQSLRVGALLSMNEVRAAVKALHTTARRWLEVAESHGLPRVEPLSQPQPALAPPSSEGWLRVLARGGRETAARLLERRRPEVAARPEPPQVEAPPPAPPLPVIPRRVPARPHPWESLWLLNGGAPIALGLTWLGWEWLLILALVVSTSIIHAAYDSRRIDREGVALWLLALSTTLGAPLTWGYSQGWGSGSVVFPYILGLTPREDGGVLKLLAFLQWGLPNLAWLGWAFMRVQREVSSLHASPRSQSARPAPQVHDGPGPTQAEGPQPDQANDGPLPTEKGKKRSGR